MNCVFPYENLPIKKKKIRRSLWKRVLSGDNIKIGGLIGAFIGLVLFYVVTVTISSTSGYYYDQNIKKQKSTAFQYNISKLQNLKLESNLWSKVDINSSVENNSIQYITIAR